jgi:hypothetical protein
MPQTCSICRHTKRSRIEELLLRNTPLRKIAEQTGTSAWAIHRHGKHIAKLLANSNERKAREASKAETLLDRVEILLTECRAIATAARKDRAWSAACSALREVRSCVELLARLKGELAQPGNQINVGVAVNMAQPASEDDGDLELTLARYVCEATNNFDVTEIERMKALCSRVFVESTPQQGMSLPQLTESTAANRAAVNRM